MNIRQTWMRRSIWAGFWRETDGLTLSEYLVLLSLLTGGILLAVASIGNTMQRAWGERATWYDGNIVALAGPRQGTGAGIDTALVIADRSLDKAASDPDAASDDVEIAQEQTADADDNDTDAEPTKGAKHGKSEKTKAPKSPK